MRPVSRSIAMGPCQRLLAFPRGLAVLAMTTLLPSPTLAQAPACALETVESVACIAGRLCTCVFGRGSAATGLPDGFRWDCGILRPACGTPLPATLDPYRGPLPDSLAIDRSTTSVTTINRNSSESSADAHSESSSRGDSTGGKPHPWPGPGP
jgi:hypothetical protein